MYTLGKVNGIFCYKRKIHSYKNDLSPKVINLVNATLKKKKEEEEEEPISHTELKNLRLKTECAGWGKGRGETHPSHSASFSLPDTKRQRQRQWEERR